MEKHRNTLIIKLLITLLGRAIVSASWTSCPNHASNLKNDCCHDKGIKGKIALDIMICENANLRSIPPDFPKSINYLEIEDDGSIETLTSSSFRNYPRLKYLMLRHCPFISSIEEDTFTLLNLVHIDMSGNSIDELPRLPNSVETLHLNSMLKSSNFFSSSVTFDRITQLTSLKTLFVMNNKLSSFPAFVKQLKSLKTIVANNNKINRLTIEDIAPLCNLEELKFEGNVIESTEDSICHCLSLKKWAFEKNIRLYNLTCPQMAGIDNKKCEMKFGEDHWKQSYFECQVKTFWWKYLLYILGVLIVLASLIVVYCYKRRKSKKAKGQYSGSYEKHDVEAAELQSKKISVDSD